MTAAAGALPGFSDRVLKFIERVEHRVATTDCERREAFRLRYEAYARNALMAPGPDRRLFDRYDNSENAWITMTFVDGELAGSLRVNVGVGVDADLPSLRVYPDVVTPRLKAGQVVVEYTRLAAKLSVSIAHPELAYVIMRPGYMAAEYFDADLAIATPRLEHMPFYRHVFGAVQWCEPREYPGLTAKFGCMGAEFRLARKNVEARFPFYKSAPIEREALFGPSEREIDLGFRTVDSAGLSRLGAELSTA
jgi:hypothetical protein